MTQKELSYVEDAIGHETNIITIVEDTIKNLEDEDLVSFMEEEVKTHTSIKEKLMSLLEGKINE